MKVMGPQYEAQYKLDMADAIIDALMESQTGGAKPAKKKEAASAPAAAGGGGMPAASMGQPSGLGSGFFRLFNTAPGNLSSLTNSIVGPRSRRSGMI
jgi:hypothetical protein